MVNAAENGMPTFARLHPEHAAIMHRLEKSCFSLPWNEAQCRSALSQTSFGAYGLWQNTDLLAYVSFYHAAGEMEIANLAVAPEQRRKGLGRLILSALLQAAAKMGIEKVLLEVRAGNSAALSLYRQAGFHQAGLRKKYYPDTGEDGFILIYNINQERPGVMTCKR